MRGLIEAVVILAPFTFWLVKQVRKNRQPKSQAPLSSASVRVAGAGNSTATNSELSTTGYQHRLRREPFIYDLENLRLNIKVGIAKDRTDMVEQFENDGALDGTYSDTEKYLFLYGAPGSLIHRAFPDPLATLQLHAHLLDSQKRSMAYKYGTFSQVELALKEFLENSSGRSSVVQERGDFDEGTYFTSDSFLHLEYDYHLDAMRVGVISRTRLEEAVNAELKKLKEFLE